MNAEIWTTGGVNMVLMTPFIVSGGGRGGGGYGECGSGRKCVQDVRYARRVRIVGLSAL